MANWTFYGRLLPERFFLSIGSPLSGSAEFQGRPRFQYKFDIVLHGSQFIIQFDIATKVDAFTLRNVALNHARQLSDYAGYLNGMHFDVDIVSCVHKSIKNNWQVFGNEIPFLAATRLRSGEKRHLNLEELSAIGGSVAVQMVLRDLSEAMRSAVGTGFFCYRAIEAMMQSMKIGDEDEKTAWPKLRDRLQISLDTLKALKKHADFPRHGKPSDMTDEERIFVLKTTYEIVDRYLHYVRSGEDIGYRFIGQQL